MSHYLSTKLHQKPSFDFQSICRYPAGNKVELPHAQTPLRNHRPAALDVWLGCGLGYACSAAANGLGVSRFAGLVRGLGDLLGVGVVAVWRL